MFRKIGRVVSDLKHTGEVRFEGESIRVESISGEVTKGERIKVMSLEGLVVVVEKFSDSPKMYLKILRIFLRA